ncbi:MAG: sensor histidine kinase [Clostridiales bacterium]|nr:sensor histidine kinase [Clostridiales bacterium]
MLILVFLPMILIVGFVYNRVFSITESEFSAYSIQTVKQIEHNIITYLTQLETMTYTIASNEVIQEYLKLPAEGYELEKINALSKVSYFEKNVRYDHAENSLLVIGGQNGEVYSSKRYMSNLNYDYNFLDNIYTQSLENENKTFLLVGTHADEFTNEDSLVISAIRKIYDASMYNNKNLLGYIYLNIDHLVLKNIIHDVVFSNDNDILILDGDTIIYSSKENNVLEVADDTLLQDIKEKKDGGQFITFGGIEYFFTHTTMNMTGWTVVNLHQMENYNQEAQRIIKSIILIALLCFLVLIFVAMAISNAITRPLKDLTLLMKKVEKDDFDVIFETKSKDETAILGSVFNSMIIRIKELIQSVYKSKLAEKDALIYALQSQINPHFLYNTLQSISNIAQLENVTDITTICQCLSSMFRYNIGDNKKFVLLYDEVINIKNYFYLKSVQHRDRIKFVIDIPEELLNIQVPRFILQPLVENSISHGLDMKPNGGVITIEAKTEDKVLIIDIEDNGVGIKEKQLEEIMKTINKNVFSNEELSTNHLGIDNVNSRLVLYYGSEHKLKIDNVPDGGARVSIRIPILN